MRRRWLGDLCTTCERLRRRCGAHMSGGVACDQITYRRLKLLQRESALPFFSAIRRQPDTQSRIVDESLDGQSKRLGVATVREQAGTTVIDQFGNAARGISD